MANNFFKFKQFTIHQERCAMKVGTDGVLIAAWANFDNARTILDVGCGTGLISIIAAQRNPYARITGVDIDSDAVEQAAQNAYDTEWRERIEIINSDFCLFDNVRYDVIVSNPPYFTEQIKSPDKSRSIARSCDTLDYKRLIEKSAEILNESGRLSIILPYNYYEEVIEHGINNKLYPERVAKVYPLPDSNVKRVMVELSRDQKDTVYEDIVIEKSRHNYSDEYIKLTKDFYLKM
ncbi:tRNA1(Val) (adenine(37)-N6)-methyltransferase [Phocaeicola paurosaccharolyticus]|uniref:tRNA1(Val) (adenine(37)-N6)-methyltransferase n=1 Tax=Phocaeicola paurosaccharolyticus TaxID=732242 RepID=UPI000469CB66|nr:methyltransferase [Phocaeicola paurosaccharolyticus]